MGPKKTSDGQTQHKRAHRLVHCLQLLLHGQLLRLQRVECRVPLSQLRQQRRVLRALLLKRIERITNLCAGSASAAVGRQAWVSSRVAWTWGVAAGGTRCRQHVSPTTSCVRYEMFWQQCTQGSRVGSHAYTHPPLANASDSCCLLLTSASKAATCCCRPATLPCRNRQGPTHTFCHARPQDRRQQQATGHTLPAKMRHMQVLVVRSFGLLAERELESVASCNKPVAAAQCVPRSAQPGAHLQGGCVCHCCLQLLAQVCLSGGCSRELLLQRVALCQRHTDTSTKHAVRPTTASGTCGSSTRRRTRLTQCPETQPRIARTPDTLHAHCPPPPPTACRPPPTRTAKPPNTKKHTKPVSIAVRTSVISSPTLH
jgi:hypothetical protein